MMIKTSLSKKSSLWSLVLSVLMFINNSYGFSVFLPETPLGALSVLLSNKAPKTELLPGSELLPNNIQSWNKMGMETFRQPMITTPNEIHETASPVIKTEESHASTDQPQTSTNQLKKNKEEISDAQLNTVRNSLIDIGQILARSRSLVLVLVWDIDGTIYYPQPLSDNEAPEHSAILEMTLSSIINSSFETWRRNGQFLLILNTARPHDRFDFFTPNFPVPLPRADYVITNGGARIFSNNTMATGFASHASRPLFSWPIEVPSDTYFNNLFPENCQRFMSSSTFEFRCPNGTAPGVIPLYSSLSSGSSDFHVWWKTYRAADNEIFFFHHEYINKGAAFARLIHWISAPAHHAYFRYRRKWVATAGDQLMDTAMMNERMDYPFREKRRTSNSPGLPIHTTYIGTVLSKAGCLQEARYKSLFKEETTVHSKIKSIAGIIEGTAELLKRQILRISTDSTQSRPAQSASPSTGD